MSDRYADRHEFFASVDDAVRRLLEENGITPALCAQCGAAVADGLAADWASQEIYIPQDYGYQLSKREVEILNRHLDGVPKHDLMREYRISRSGLNRLLKRARTRDPNLGQGMLFEQ